MYKHKLAAAFDIHDANMYCHDYNLNKRHLSKHGSRISQRPPRNVSVRAYCSQSNTKLICLEC